MRSLVLFFILASTLALTACDTSVNVAATANVGARYSNVRITVKELWVNESATASIDDTTWLKFPLPEPVTLDLVGLTSGTLNEFATGLKVTPGTYRQVRVFLVDRTETLTSAAQTAGATYNDEVTYFDANNVQGTLPLEIPNAAQGIGIETELVVQASTDAILTALSSASSSASSTTTGTDTTSTTTTTTTTTPPTTTFTGLDSSTTVTGKGLLVFDANRDLTPFLFGDQPGFLLNPSLSAYDERRIGTIQGQLDLSQLTINTGTGRPDLEVTAEKLNDDSTRRIEVGSAPITADGAFTLYPLPLDESASTTTYDLVIHGPSVRTIVIRQVPVTKGAPASGSAVSLGTVTLTASTSYAANGVATTPVFPRGARVGFYQTLPDDNAPYLIEQHPVDPLSGRLATDATLSDSATIVYGTFGTSFLAAAPQEGASKYSVAALSSLYGNGAFSNTLLAPPPTTTDTVAFTVPDVQIPSTAASGTIAALVSATTPGKYDKGALLVTHNGAVVTTVSLDEALAGTSATVNVTGIPASSSAAFDRGLYYLEAWAWNSSDPQTTLVRQPVSAAVDLRSALSATATVTIN
jgi:hypothetical protein